MSTLALGGAPDQKQELPVAPVPSIWAFNPTGSYVADPTGNAVPDGKRAGLGSTADVGNPAASIGVADTAVLLSPVLPSADWQVLQKRVSDLRTAFAVLQQTVGLLHDQNSAQQQQLQAHHDLVSTLSAQNSQLQQHVQLLASSSFVQLDQNQAQVIQQLQEQLQHATQSNSQLAAQLHEAELELQSSRAHHENVLAAERKERERLVLESAQCRLLCSARNRQIAQLQQQLLTAQQLQEADRQQHADHKMQADQASDELRTTVGQLQQKAEAAEKLVAELQSQLHAQQMARGSAEAKAATMEAEVRDLQLQKEWTDSKMEELEEAPHNRRLLQYQHEIQRLQASFDAERRQLQEQADSSRSEAAVLQQQLDDAFANVEQLSAALQAASSRKGTENGDVDELGLAAPRSEDSSGGEPLSHDTPPRSHQLRASDGSVQGGMDGGWVEMAAVVQQLREELRVERERAAMLQEQVQESGAGRQQLAAALGLDDDGEDGSVEGRPLLILVEAGCQTEAVMTGRPLPSLVATGCQTEAAAEVDLVAGGVSSSLLAAAREEILRLQEINTRLLESHQRHLGNGKDKKHMPPEEVKKLVSEAREQYKQRLDRALQRCSETWAARLSDVEQDLAAARADAAAAATRTAELEKKMQALEEQATTANHAELQALQAQLQSTRADVERLERHLVEAQAEATALQAKHEQALQAVRQEAEADAAAAVMEASTEAAALQAQRLAEARAALQQQHQRQVESLQAQLDLLHLQLEEQQRHQQHQEQQQHHQQGHQQQLHDQQEHHEQNHHNHQDAFADDAQPAMDSTRAFVESYAASTDSMPTGSHHKEHARGLEPTASATSRLPPTSAPLSSLSSSSSANSNTSLPHAHPPVHSQQPATTHYHDAAIHQPAPQTDTPITSLPQPRAAPSGTTYAATYARDSSDPPSPPNQHPQKFSDQPPSAYPQDDDDLCLVSSAQGTPEASYIEGGRPPPPARWPEPPPPPKFHEEPVRILPRQWSSHDELLPITSVPSNTRPTRHSLPDTLSLPQPEPPELVPAPPPLPILSLSSPEKHTTSHPSSSHRFPSDPRLSSLRQSAILLQLKLQQLAQPATSQPLSNPTTRPSAAPASALLPAPLLDDMISALNISQYHRERSQQQEQMARRHALAAARHETSALQLRSSRLGLPPAPLISTLPKATTHPLPDTTPTTHPSGAADHRTAQPTTAARADQRDQQLAGVLLGSGQGAQAGAATTLAGGGKAVTLTQQMLRDVDRALDRGQERLQGSASFSDVSSITFAAKSVRAANQRYASASAPSPYS